MRKRMLRFAFLFLFVFCIPLAYARGDLLKADVKAVKDGDTIVVSPVEGGQFITCRLYGIDAPETGKRGKSGQPYGDESERFLKKLILGKTIQVETTGEKTYNRDVCRLTYEGKDINLLMVSEGYAWAYRQYLKRPHASEYIEAETQARKERKGLWKDINPTPPWEFRRNTK